MTWESSPRPDFNMAKIHTGALSFEVKPETASHPVSPAAACIVFTNRSLLRPRV